MEKLSVPEMIWQVRSMTSRKQLTGNVTNQEICAWLDHKQSQIYAYIYSLKKKQFIFDEDTIDYVANQADYDLPAGYASMEAIWRDDLSGKPNMMDRFIKPWEIPNYAGQTWTATGNEYWTIVNDKLRIVPTPTANVTGAMGVVCGVMPARLIAGEMDDTSSATTIVVTRPWIKMAHVTDFYKGRYFGVVHKDYMYDPLKYALCSGYAVSGITRTLTIADVTTDLDANYYFGIIPTMPDYTLQAMIVGAAILCRRQNKEPVKDLKDEFDALLQGISLMAEGGESKEIPQDFFDWDEGSDIFPSETT